MDPLLLAVRADSMQTQAILSDTSGQVYGRAKVANGEASTTLELLRRVYEEATVSYLGIIPPLRAIVALPGLNSASVRRSAADLVKAILPRGSRILLCDELEPLLAAGLGGESGLLLVSGHQAVVGSVDLRGVFRRTEDPLHELGQEGSALWLGTRTLQLIARLREGRLPTGQRLPSLFYEHFNQDNLCDIWNSLMDDPPDAENILKLAQKSVRLAAFPDPEPACRALVVRGARRLADLIVQAQAEASELTKLATCYGNTASGALLDEVKRQTEDLLWATFLRSELEGCIFMARCHHRFPSDLEQEYEVDEASASLWLTMRERKDQLW